MPLQTYHVTSSAGGGIKTYFGKDIVDGWPIGPVTLPLNQTFYYDPHADNFQRLQILSQSTKYAAGSGSLSTGTPSTFGTQNRWFRTGMGTPTQENL